MSMNGMRDTLSGKSSDMSITGQTGPTSRSPSSVLLRSTSTTWWPGFRISWMMKPSSRLRSVCSSRSFLMNSHRLGRMKNFSTELYSLQVSRFPRTSCPWPRPSWSVCSGFTLTSTTSTSTRSCSSRRRLTSTPPSSISSSSYRSVREHTRRSRQARVTVSERLFLNWFLILSGVQSHRPPRAGAAAGPHRETGQQGQIDASGSLDAFPTKPFFFPSTPGSEMLFDTDSLCSSSAVLPEAHRSLPENSLLCFLLSVLHCSSWFDTCWWWTEIWNYISLAFMKYN